MAKAERMECCLVCFWACFFATLMGCVRCKEEMRVADRIVRLPGQPKVSFEQYSGYVTVNRRHGRALFYWLTEAVNNSGTKPLVLWLNGGPGCSSIAFGASEEIGPFRINRTGASLYLNKYSWNREANILFLESPAGVGFSYSNRSSDLRSFGDERTAQDSLRFLVRWFSRFPHYRHRDFYIAGESYAGHYIPQLAKKIVNFNNASSKLSINFNGIIVGNGLMDKHMDSIGTVTYWWSHALISDESFRTILSRCNFSIPKRSEACYNALDYVMNHELGNIDIYSIYTPVCSSKINASQTLGLMSTFLRRPPLSGINYDPCTQNYAKVYFNRPDVQKAMHANSTNIPRRWTPCSNVLIRNWKDSQFSMLPTYRELIKAGLRIWIYSGDTDAVVPVTATRFSLSRLNLTVKTRWYPWYSGNEVGGWSEVYQGLTFATVRGAGHEVPLFQPRRALRLFLSFLSGNDLTRSPIPP